MTIPACAVGAIVLDDGSLLLVKRDREPGRGRWSLPGGKVEEGESLREALVREVREECGIDVEPDSLIGVAEWISRDDGGAVDHHYVIVDFTAKARSRNIKAGDDAADVRWVPVADLSAMQLSDGLLEFLGDRGVLDGRKPRV